MHIDRFGNDVRHFDVIHPHQRLMATAISEVLTPEMLVPDMAPLTPLDEFDFRMPDTLCALRREPHAICGRPCRAW